MKKSAKSGAQWFVSGILTGQDGNRLNALPALWFVVLRAILGFLPARNVLGTYLILCCHKPDDQEDIMSKLKAKGWRRVAEELRGIAFVVLGVLIARSSFADHYYVPSGSMEYTLIAGDRVVVDKMAYGLRVPFTDVKITEGAAVSRGDIVIFDSPRDGVRLIKRIVAVGGDSVAVRNGHLFINDEPMASAGDSAREIFGDRVASLNLSHGGGPDFEQTLEDGMLLAIGDHRGNSLDGRIFGLIEEGRVYGRALAVYYRSGDGFVWNGL